MILKKIKNFIPLFIVTLILYKNFKIKNYSGNLSTLQLETLQLRNVKRVKKLKEKCEELKIKPKTPFFIRIQISVQNLTTLYDFFCTAIFISFESIGM